MGHDTTAYLGRGVPEEPHSAASRTELGDEIAFLCGRRWQYAALGAEEYDGGVSGIGIGRWFRRHDLRAALAWLRINARVLDPAGDSIGSTVEFFETCLQRLPADQHWVYIDFG